VRENFKRLVHQGSDESWSATGHRADIIGRDAHAGDADIPRQERAAEQESSESRATPGCDDKVIGFRTQACIDLLLQFEQCIQIAEYRDRIAASCIEKIAVRIEAAPVEIIAQSCSNG